MNINDCNNFKELMSLSEKVYRFKIIKILAKEIFIFAIELIWDVQ